MISKSIPVAVPQGSLFEELREGYAFVAASARHVRINVDRIAPYAAALPGHAPFNLLDVRHHFTGRSEEETAAYIMALDTLNFGSGYEPGLVAEGWTLINDSLYFTISTRLKERFENRVMMAEEMAGFTVADMAALLALPSGRYGQEFAALCAKGLNDLGAWILQKGAFAAAVEDSAEKMVATLLVLPQFRDAHDYRNRSVAFHKRAQIAASDLDLAFRRHGRVLFHDIGNLTLFADNAVPHVLRVDGILEYTPDLAVRIDNGEEISSGSEEEIEIRACAAHAAELVAEAAGVTVRDVDHILWHRSEEERRYRLSRPHRTRSVFY
jgi:hypothetical protein